MRLKKVAAFAMAAVLAFGLVGCGSSGSSKSASSKNSKKITVWAWDEAFNIKAAKEAAEIYKGIDKDAEINVVTMAQDDIVAKLNTSLSSKSYDGLPDVVLIEDYRIQGYLQSYEDEFYDLSSVIKNDDFAEYKTGVNNINGKVYGVPFDSGVAGLFYRTDILEQAGYKADDLKDITWEKYIEIGKKVKEKTGKYMCTLDPSDIGQIRMMLQSAGAWYTDKDGKVTVSNNQAMKDAIKIYKDLVDAGITKQTSDWNQFVGAFNNGDVASVITGCWIAPSIKAATDQSGKWAVAAFPRMGSNSSSVNASSIGGAGWYVLKNTGNSELAADFLAKTFGSNADIMNSLAKDISLVSTLNKASDCQAYKDKDDFFGGQEVFGDLASWTAKVPSVNYGLHTYAIEDMMTEAVSAIVGGADMDKTLKSYQSKIEAAVQ